MLKSFKKIRAQTIEYPSTTASPILNTFEADHDSKETKDEVFANDDLTFNVSPQTDISVESNTEETKNPDVTVNASNVDTNIDYGEPISTLLPEPTCANLYAYIHII